MARALVLGVLGAMLGWLLGNALYYVLADRVFSITRPEFASDGPLLVGALIAGPVFAAAASLVPIAMAARTDPARMMETT